MFCNIVVVVVVVVVLAALVGCIVKNIENQKATRDPSPYFHMTVAMTEKSVNPIRGTHPDS